MTDFTTMHAQVIIAFSLAMIVVLLAYLAFFKDPTHPSRDKRK
jgi:hypothetical protein